MPVQRCQSEGKPGLRWGRAGKCYRYTPGSPASRRRARSRAQAQGVAAEGPQAVFGSRQEPDLADLDVLFDSDFWRELRSTLLGVLTPFFRDAFLEGAVLAADVRPVRRSRRQVEPPTGPTELPFDWEAINTAADDVVLGYSDQWWTQFERTTQERIRQSILRAQREGLPTQAVIDDLVPLFGPQRARLIAVSETTNLVGQGAQETYRQAGFSEWEWRTVRDARVDPICEALDRETFPNSQRFQRAHPNCRCWPVPAGRAGLNIVPRSPTPFGLNFPRSLVPSLG